MNLKLKNPTQIEKIRESGRILSRTLHTLGKLVQPGVSPIDIDHECRRLLKEAGATPAFLDYHGFPSSICVSVNEQVIHGIPTTRKFQPGDVVGLDIGVDLEGYISDSAYTFAVEPVSQEIAQLLSATKEALRLGIEAAKPGGRIHDISRAIYRHVRQFGYGVVRPYCGHGVGFDVHEDPQVPNYVSAGPNPRLKPGMVLAVEPMVNLGKDDVYVLDDDWTVVTRDGSISAHFEHTIAVREDRIEILTELEQHHPVEA
ncbi:MAG: type I methionyl aminopeptidase [Spirochaetales bacterium]